MCIYARSCIIVRSLSTPNRLPQSIGRHYLTPTLAAADVVRYARREFSVRVSLWIGWGG